MKPSQTGTAGFTLVELMVTVVITGFISAGMYQMMQAGQASANRSRLIVEMQQNARVGIQALADDLREVSYGKDPTQPSIHYAGPDSCVFVADIVDENPGAEIVTYFLSPDGDPDTANPDDTVLMKVVSDTAGVVLVEAPQSYGIKAGSLSFAWFNGGGVELPNPVPQPEEVGEVFVQLTSATAQSMRSGEGQTTYYPEMTLSSTIYPRNLPLSPARSRPSIPGCDGPDYPDCESATLNWTAPTTNTDGTTLDFEDISHFNFYFGTDSSDLPLFTRLARTITSWTVNGLEADQAYYVAVSAVSRSGVESYLCTKSASVGSVLVPKAPSTLTAILSGSEVSLSWAIVTQFTNDESITVPVDYEVHRSETSGFTPDATTLIGSLTATTTYTDATLTSCSIYYYKVLAMACSNPSDPTAESSVAYPSPPSCPITVVAAPGVDAGTVSVSWYAPVTRTDGTALNGADIDRYYVYADTVSGNTMNYLETVDNSLSWTLTGLESCQTYYINVRAIDSCGSIGDLCLGKEVSIGTTAPCNPDIPETPATLDMQAFDDHVSLTWPTSADCDVVGYKIYYGHSPGVYTGTAAAEGPSPVTVLAENVTQGSLCAANLTALGSCTFMAVRVTAVDACEIPNESGQSPEASASTTCAPCMIADGCTLWGVDTGNAKVHLELYPTNSQNETLTKIKPAYTASASVKEVWFGRPLAKIWAFDGSAGEDGNIGAQPPGALLNVTDVTVPSWATSKDGMPMAVLFDSDVRDVPITYTFSGLQGTCDASGTGRGANLVDDFDDGNYTGWTVVSGTWAVTSGELRQSLTSSNYVIRVSSLSLGACTIEAKVKCTGGSQHSVYLVYRYQDANNLGLFGIRTDQSKVRAARLNGGTFTETASYTMSLTDGTWYTLKVVINGTNVKGYINCNQVLNFTDASLWSTGSVGISCRRGSGSFDDIKVFTGEALP